MTFSPLPPMVRRGGLWLIGNYDGVHCGHQFLIAQALKKGQPVSLLTFEPHPRAFFAPETPPFRLTPWPEREARLQACGVSQALVRPFDAVFAAMTADTFIANVLEQQCGAVGVVVGEDFCFGADRQGTPHLLRARWGDARVHIVSPLMASDGQPCSSSRIRDALRAGDIPLATSLLGRPWSLTGLALTGPALTGGGTSQFRGRFRRVPTARIALGDYLRPRYGTYEVTVDGLGPGVAHLGGSPVTAHMPETLDVHLPNGAGDLSGQSLTVHLHAFLGET